MADDLSKTGKQDDSRINVNQGHEVSDWCSKWKITPSTLKAAVQAAGVMARDVEAWLRKNGHIK